MAASRTPYEDTSVPVVRSQERIRSVLRESGARGVQFEEEWTEGEARCVVRFAWPHAASDHVSVVRLEAKPLPPKSSRVNEAQRERQAWRGLAWYLESNLKAATFGLIPFEAIFLAHFEGPGGKTIGEAIIPQVEQGQLALPAGVS
jgi:hypothetical protein